MEYAHKELFIDRAVKYAIEISRINMTSNNHRSKMDSKCGHTVVTTTARTASMMLVMAILAMRTADGRAF